LELNESIRGQLVELLVELVFQLVDVLVGRVEVIQGLELVLKGPEACEILPVGTMPLPISQRGRSQLGLDTESLSW
jgi:hypothetical protein